MNAKNNKNNSIKEFLKKIKPEYVLAVAAVVAIIAMFASGIATQSKTEENEANTAESYVQMLENKLSGELSKIKGAGKVSVIISVERGITNELATQTGSSLSGEKTQEPVIVNGKPIVLGEVYPEIRGVVIVAQGGDKLAVKMSILNAAMVFLSVDASKIEILTMK